MTEKPDKFYMCSEGQLYEILADIHTVETCIRSEIHDALVKAADELVKAGNRLADNAEAGHYSPPDQNSWDAALTAYRKARGGEEKINWRDDPEAIVEDDEPMIGRDYE